MTEIKLKVEGLGKNGYFIVYIDDEELGSFVQFCDDKAEADKVTKGILEQGGKFQNIRAIKGHGVSLGAGVWD